MGQQPSQAEVGQGHTLQTHPSRSMLNCGLLTHSNRSSAYSPTSTKNSAPWSIQNESRTRHCKSTRSGYQPPNATSYKPFRSTTPSWGRTQPTSDISFAFKSSYDAHVNGRLSEKKNTSDKQKRKIVGTITVVIMASIIFALYSYSFYLLID